MGLRHYWQGIYFSLIIGLESLVVLMTGRDSQQPGVLVVSTLVIAALFQPLRHRIQQNIDRRFYRRRYDTAKTLGAFSAQLSNKVDLNQVCEQLLAVVQETMQPTVLSLWVFPVSQQDAMEESGGETLSWERVAKHETRSSTYVTSRL